MGKSDPPRKAGFQKILEDLLFQTAVVPSIESGLLDNLDGAVVVGDGSIMPTAASADGKPTCACRQEGVYKCEHDRLHASPTAEWRRNHRTNSFVFGDRYCHLIVACNGHDFPLQVVMPGGNESDYTLSLKAIDRLLKTAKENGVEIQIVLFCGDGHHDSYAHCEYFDAKGIVPVVPLSENSKPVAPHPPGRNEVRLDEDGTPLCPALARMRHHQFDKSQNKHVYCCPAKRMTRTNRKPVYVFREDSCPRKADCKPESSLGPFVHIKSETDPRLYPPLPRKSKKFKEIAKKRSASERMNSVLDFYNIENTCRNADYGLIRITLAFIAHHASVRYREESKSPSAPLGKNRAAPDAEKAAARVT